MYHIQPDSISILRSTVTSYKEDILLCIMTYMRVGMKATPPIFFSFKRGTTRVSCLTHWIVTLFISYRIISAPVSDPHSTQQQCKMVDAVDIHSKH